ncbi:MAG TPA: hypothetical protein VFW04_15235 [Gemmatimonadaceae bacterium]|nr:hypothetical protein [Gemmatimonadaceae bacterium]
MRIHPVVIALGVLALAAACGKHKAKDDTNAQIAELSKKLGLPIDTSGAPQNTEGDPCSLLDPAQVAAAIGPLAAPPYRGSYKPERGSDSCRYDTRNHRRLLVSVDWNGGKIAMKMVGMGRSLTDPLAKHGEETIGQTVLSTGDTIAGPWDAVAEGPMQCCDLHALKGDQHVEIDWTGTRLSMTGAAKLLDSAVAHLAKPLAINGSAPAAMASGDSLYAADAKDSTVNICQLLPQPVVEAIIGRKLSAPPEPGQAGGASGGRLCTYTTTMIGSTNLRQRFELELRDFHDGAADFATDQHTIGIAGRAMRRQITGDTIMPPTDTSEYPLGPWDEAGPSTSMGYEAVKGPNLIRVGALGERKTALALLAKAVTSMP